MKYHSFYMRLLCLILIIGAVLGYNFMQKNDTQALQITCKCIGGTAERNADCP